MWPPAAGFKPAAGLGTVKGGGGFQWCGATLLQYLTWLTNRVCQLLIPTLTGSIPVGSYPFRAACHHLVFSFRRKVECWGFSEMQDLQDIADVFQPSLWRRGVFPI